MSNRNGAVAEQEEEVAEVETFEAEPAPDEPNQTPESAAPEEMPAFEREHYEKIRDKEQAVRRLEYAYNDAKREAKDAKDAFEDADRELRDLIARGPERQKKFELKPDDTPAENDAWREAEIGELELSNTILTKLIESGVETIGQLEDLRAGINDRTKEWPSGIGPAKITAIEDAIVDWLSTHRDSWGKPEGSGEIQSVTISSPGRDSVTLTPEAMERLAENCEKVLGK